MEPTAGAYSCIIWELPPWNIIFSEGYYELNLTVNDSEYDGMIKCLEAAYSLGIRDLVLFGDSRIALHQATGALRSHKPNLEAWLNKFKTLMLKFNSVKPFHVPILYNPSAYYIATKHSN